MRNSWIVSQIGARQHYAVPRGFNQRRQLRLFYTDAWCSYGSSIFGHGTRRMRAFAGRLHEELPASKVVSFNLRAIFEWCRAKSAGDSVDRRTAEYLRVGRWFASAVAADLEDRDLDPTTDAFLGFNTGCLETLHLLNARKIPTVCDQIDPALVEEDLIIEEATKWPGWQPPEHAGRAPPAYWARMRAEWDAATLVLVNSEWSKSALIRQGVPEAKIFISPINFEPPLLKIRAAQYPSQLDEEIFTVLWVGTVNLRKGIQYLVQAARMLQQSKRIQFVVIGELQISNEAVTSAPQNMQFLGPLPRDLTQEYFSRASLFALPTLSDGFAITQLEAMSNGVPVITTPRCGAVVTDGVDGIIVPPADAIALADAIAGIEGDRSMLRQMQKAAIAKSQCFRLPTQARQIDAQIQQYRLRKGKRTGEHQSTRA